jgi:hypothetical protein
MNVHLVTFSFFFYLEQSRNRLSPSAKRLISVAFGWLIYFFVEKLEKEMRSRPLTLVAPTGGTDIFGSWERVYFVKCGQTENVLSFGTTHTDTQTNRKWGTKCWNANDQVPSTRRWERKKNANFSLMRSNEDQTQRIWLVPGNRVNHDYTGDTLR